MPSAVLGTGDVQVSEIMRSLALLELIDRISEVGIIISYSCLSIK